MNKWFKFCKDKIEKIEKVWNKKLEDESVVESDKEPSNDSEEREKKEYEEELAKMFANFQEKTAEKNPKKDGRSQSFAVDGTSGQDPDLVAAKQSAFTGTQDDMAVKPTYSDNQFWAAPEMYDLDELLKEAE